MLKNIATLVAFFIFFVLQACCVFAYSIDGEEEALRGSGPIAVKNQMPLYLFYLQMSPDKASVVEKSKFVIDADYLISNVTVSAFTPATSLYQVDIDLEVSRITLDLRYGLCNNLEVGLEIPYISLSSGYTDNFVEGIEDGIGARTPRSRERQGSYEFDYTLIYNNKKLIEKKHSTDGIGDISLGAKYQILKEDKGFLPNLSLRSAVKFPTADEDEFLGSGKFDYGAGFLLDKGFFDRLYFYLGANIIFIDKPGFLSDLGIKKDYYSGMVAMEYFFTERFSVVAQVSGNSTPYPSTGTNVLENDAYEFGLGVNYTWKEKQEVSCYFAIIENINSASSPDVSFETGLNWNF
ncbi:MAG: DUF3187 family protein [Candidatus Omnitrophica bacterium]|nr:DUF3187 family protein [Candidatus Omnitrophota bacterium]MBU1933198.1 DUF3187 family protein [Candidatus Omnitrophota bacterium]